MPYCSKCGGAVHDEISFCPQCGGAIGASARPVKFRIQKKGLRGPDILGIISAGVILIILAITYLRYPIGPAVILDYIQSMSDLGAFIKPPLTLLNLVAFFLYTTGIWGIVLSGLRIIFQRSVRKALGDLIGGFFSLFCAYLLTSYATDVITGQIALGYFVITIGIIVIGSTIVYFTFPEKRQ